MFESLKRAKLQRMLNAVGPGPTRVELPIDERRKAYFFNGANGEQRMLIRLDHVTGPVRVLSFQRTPKHMLLADHLRFDAVLGWAGHIEHHDAIGKIMQCAPLHRYGNHMERMATWRSSCGRFDAMMSRQSSLAYAHIFMPPGESYKLPVGQVVDLDCYTIATMVIDPMCRYNGQSVFRFTTGRRWGYECECPSIVPASVDLDAACDSYIELDDEGANDFLLEFSARNP